MLDLNSDMPLWQQAFRVGVAPSLSVAGLEALLLALETDDPRLIQGGTVTPYLGFPFESPQGACAIGYALWQAKSLYNIGDVEDAFCETCTAIDDAIGGYTCCAHFTRWFDSVPRAAIISALIPEVKLALEGRKETAS